MECLLGDTRKEEMASYNRYLAEFDAELNGLVQQRDKYARELSDKFTMQSRNEQKCLESIVNGLEASLKEFRYNTLPKLLPK